MKHDKPFAIQVLKGYLEAPDDQVLEVTYDYYSKTRFATVPLSESRVLQHSARSDFKTNEAAKNFDLNKLVDASYVQSAADRKIDKS